MDLEADSREVAVRDGRLTRIVSCCLTIRRHVTELDAVVSRGEVGKSEHRAGAQAVPAAIQEQNVPVCVNGIAVGLTGDLERSRGRLSQIAATAIPERHGTPEQIPLPAPEVTHRLLPRIGPVYMLEPGRQSPVSR